jgi:GNAT superfamily N-acetyltransferase
MPKLHPATEADAPALADIRVEAMRPSLKAMGRFDPDRARTRFLSKFTASETQIIREKGEVAGFIVVRVRQDHVCLEHLYIRARFQGCGIGRVVVTELQEKARSLGLPIRLMALRGSPANGFYQSCGFVQTIMEEFDIHYEWTSDKNSGSVILPTSTLAPKT